MLVLPTPGDLESLMTNQVLRECGIAGALLLVDGSRYEPECLSGGSFGPEVLEGMGECYQPCWNRRLSSEVTLFTLDGEASHALGSWIDERSRYGSTLDLADPGIIGHLSSLALKVALLLHLGRGGGERKVSMETMEPALRLSDALVSGDIQLRLGHGRQSKPGQDGAGSEIELVYARLRMRGPQTLRDLTRSFHRRPTAEVREMVDAAVDAGVVQERDGKFIPVEVERLVGA